MASASSPTNDVYLEISATTAAKKGPTSASCDFWDIGHVPLAARLTVLGVTAGQYPRDGNLDGDNCRPLDCGNRSRSFVKTFPFALPAMIVTLL